MNLIKRLALNENGSAVTENIGWIAFFVMVMIGVIALFATQMGGAMKTQGNTILAKTYDTWCATNQPTKPYWDGNTVADGANPTCQAAARP